VEGAHFCEELKNARNRNQSKTPLLFRATAVGCCLLGKEMTCSAEYAAGAELWSAEFLIKKIMRS
jgi:hypothetical protein